MNELTQKQQEIEAPYEDTTHALKSIYGAQADEIIQFNAFFMELRGGTVALTAPMSKWERIGQAAMGMSLIKSILHMNERNVLDAVYTVANGHALVSHKELTCRLVAFQVAEKLREYPRWYMADITRGWAGLRRNHDDKWWADHLGKSTKTLQRFRNGNQNKDGVLTVLDRWHDSAVSKLVLPMYECGLIKYEA